VASADRPTNQPETRLTPSDLTCKACGHEWEATSLLGGSLEQWVAWLEQQECPNCHQAYRLEHQRHREPSEYLSLPPPYQPPKSQPS